MGTIAKTILIISIAILGAGCASTPYPAGQEASAGDLVKPQNDREFSVARKASGISQASWLYARSVYENPVNRPVSHFTTLGSIALKSTGGFLRRVAIGTTRMPALTGDVRVVANAEPMDTEAFEKTLVNTVSIYVPSPEGSQAAIGAIKAGRKEFNIHIQMNIPFHKPFITEDEISEVVDSLRSGWLTTGSRCVEFEKAFA